MDPDLRIAYDHLVRRGGGRGPAGYVLTGEKGSGLTVRRRPHRRVDLHVEAAGERRHFALLPTGSFVDMGWPPGQGPWVAEYHPEKRPPEIVLETARGSEVLRLPDGVRAVDLSPARLPEALEPLAPVPLVGGDACQATLAVGEYVALDLSFGMPGRSCRVHWTDVWQEEGGRVWFRSYSQGPHQWLEVRCLGEVLDRFDITAL